MIISHKMYKLAGLVSCLLVGLWMLNTPAYAEDDKGVEQSEWANQLVDYCIDIHRRYVQDNKKLSQTRFQCLNQSYKTLSFQELESDVCSPAIADITKQATTSISWKGTHNQCTETILSKFSGLGQLPDNPSEKLKTNICTQNFGGQQVGLKNNTNILQGCQNTIDNLKFIPSQSQTDETTAANDSNNKITTKEAGETGETGKKVELIIPGDYITESNKQELIKDITAQLKTQLSDTTEVKVEVSKPSAKKANNVLVTISKMVFVFLIVLILAIILWLINKHIKQKKKNAETKKSREEEKKRNVEEANATQKQQTIANKVYRNIDERHRTESSSVNTEKIPDSIVNEPSVIIKNSEAESIERGSTVPATTSSTEQKSSGKSKQVEDINEQDLPILATTFVNWISTGRGKKSKLMEALGQTDSQLVNKIHRYNYEVTFFNQSTGKETLNIGSYDPLLTSVLCLLKPEDSVGYAYCRQRLSTISTKWNSGKWYQVRQNDNDLDIIKQLT